MMPCGESIETHRAAALKKETPLHRAITFDTRIWGIPSGICTHIGIYNSFIKCLSEVEDVVRDVELGSNASRILNIGHRAAA
jgi:hypothetical protein